MNTRSDAVPGFAVDSQEIAPAALSPTRPLYWSVRRELWENRSIYIAPLVVAAFVLLGFLVSTVTLPERMRTLSALTPAERHEVVTMPYSAVAAALIATAFLVGVFYSLDALHGERRDRSILFWKSLPVSDLTTVLSKAAIPLVVLPALVFAVAVAGQLIMLLVSVAVLLGSGVGVTMWWREVQFFPSLLALLYAVAAIALWHAPVYGWLLLVSAWARRAAFLWALLPPLALGLLERLAFDTAHVQSLLQYRLIGWIGRAFVVEPDAGAVTDHLGLVAPGKLLSTPGLWIGLAFAAACLAAAVWLRRYREPI